MASSKAKFPRSRKAHRAGSEAARLAPGSTADLAVIDYTRLQSISRLVQLENVELISVDFGSQADPRPAREDESSERAFALNIVDARWHRQGTLFEIVLGYEVSAAMLRREGEDNDRPLFRLAATWVATYTLPEDFQWSEDHEEVAADFVIANGQINVFPFLRQLVVDITAKGGWPPLFLPVFRVPKHRVRGLVRTLPAWGSGMPNEQ